MTATDEDLNSFFRSVNLPVQLKSQIITLLRKPDKDPLECGSYRPIQLLHVNVDQKILEKIIAARINEILPCVIHKDQTGFVQNRLVGDNMRKLINKFYNAKTLTTPVVLFL